MNIDEILGNILKAANLPHEKREDFINTFYRYLFSRQLQVVEEADGSSAKKLVEVMRDSEAKEEELKKVLSEISKSPKIKEKMDRVSSEVINELVDEISAAATAEQKQKILDSLPS